MIANVKILNTKTDTFKLWEKVNTFDSTHLMIIANLQLSLCECCRSHYHDNSNEPECAVHVMLEMTFPFLQWSIEMFLSILLCLLLRLPKEERDILLSSNNRTENENRFSEIFLRTYEDTSKVCVIYRRGIY